MDTPHAPSTPPAPAPAAVAELASRLEDALARCELLGQVSSDTVLDWDLETNAIRFGPGLTTLLGHPAVLADSHFDWWAEQLHPDDRERVLLGLEACLAPGHDSWADEFRFRKGDLSYAMVFARGRFRRDPAGKPLRMIGALADVSDRRRMEQRLVFADRMASVGALAAGVAHEVNNPLTYTLTSLTAAGEQIDTLRNYLPPDGTEADPSREALFRALRAQLNLAAQAVREAQTGADRVRRIVGDLKTFARANEDDHAQPVDVRAAMEGALALAWNEIRHRATLEKAYGEVPRVRANESRLGQVFLNLIVNAAQAIPLGYAGRNVIAVATSREPDGRVRVDVRDTGSGITPEAQKRLFEPFFTTKQPGEWTGLGLAICKSIVEELGGEIRVQSELRKGSTFTVLLPPAPEETWDLVQNVAPKPSVLITEPDPASEPRVPRGRVLVIDDEPLVRGAVARTLAGHHDVAEAVSGVDALVRLRSGERFDAILCDLMMPEMTGMELFEELSSTIPEQAGRVVFLSGGAFTPAAQEFLDHTPRPKLEKPFKAWELRGAVASVIAEQGIVAPEV